MNIPTLYVYEDVMNILNGANMDDQDGKQKALEYKAKILGNTSLKYAPKEYWDIGMILELGISPLEWRNFSVNDKAIIFARQYIKNMVEVIDAHYKEQDRIKEQRVKEVSKGGKD